MTLIDLISMLTYLNHDDELSIDANQVYELVRTRKSENFTLIRDLKLEIESSSDDDDRSEFLSSDESPNTNSKEEIKVSEFEGFYPTTETKVESKRRETIMSAVQDLAKGEVIVGQKWMGKPKAIKFHPPQFDKN